MPPHLHPRSRSTSTLFTTCLTISFLVVGAPHVLPSCPVNPRQFSESGGDGRRRRRKVAPTEAVEGNIAGDDRTVATERKRLEREAEQDVERIIADGQGANELLDNARRRECPVPKPGGLFGQIMGFRNGTAVQEKSDVVVRPVARREWKSVEDER